MNHDEDYPPEYLAGILKEVKTIAMVGASSDPTKFSYGMLRVVHETGYDMIPVNPLETGTGVPGTCTLSFAKCRGVQSRRDRPTAGTGDGTP
jgi:predicted CoA-binding protein